MGVKRSLQTGGNLLNLLTSLLTVLSTATNYWTRQQGGHSGLWQECTHGTCSNIPCQRLLLLIALTGYTAKNAWKPEVFFSWSYFFGWLALPFSFLAGKPTVTSRDSPTPALQTPAHPMETRLEPPSLVPRQARSSAPGPTFLPRSALPPCQASAFCWRT
uniref:claudin domain-containing protein 2 isoform X3 n=1 Tax=Myodes glareolus TaxID=447135 RepID=UPI002020B8AD|nr:claudin domain-containing protein 2 isoform X3 [Myodes glareolus]